MVCTSTRTSLNDYKGMPCGCAEKKSYRGSPMDEAVAVHVGEIREPDENVPRTLAELFERWEVDEGRRLLPRRRAGQVWLKKGATVGR